jgi:hypothetical protein
MQLTVIQRWHIQSWQWFDPYLLLLHYSEIWHSCISALISIVSYLPIKTDYQRNVVLHLKFCRSIHTYYYHHDVLWWFICIDSNDDNFHSVIFLPTKLFLRDMLEETWCCWEAVIVDGRITWLWSYCCRLFWAFFCCSR